MTLSKAPFIQSIAKQSVVFQPTLPGYNHSFGPVYTSFKFASKARPVPDKLRHPNYGCHRNLLFNQKCRQLESQGVLLDPMANDIQAVMSHNSWVVTKPSSASIPWDKCKVKDVSLVVGLDPLNKFLMDPPGKVTKTESIYPALANWESMVSAWSDIQQSCPDLGRVHALLMSGRTLSKKERRVEDVRTYLRKCTLNKQDLVNHPLPNQMRKQFSRQYWMLDEGKTLQKVFDSCDVPCQASLLLPKETLQYSTDTKPEGQHFNVDVMEGSSQKILVLLENLTSFTNCIIFMNQTKPALREALVILTSRLKLGDHLSIRVDGQSSLSSRRKDQSLDPFGIFLDVGQPKNVNENAPADKAIREHTGRSAEDLWLSRDHRSGDNIHLDKAISSQQFANRTPSHLASSKYSSRNGKPVSVPSLKIGDMVFVKSDWSKSKARDSFVVAQLDNSKMMATVQKFPMSHFRHHPINVQYQNLYPCSAVPPTTLTDSPSLPPTPTLSIPTKTPSFTPKYVLTSTPIYTPDSDSDFDDEDFSSPLFLFPTPLREPVDDFHLPAAVDVVPLLDDPDDPKDYYIPFLDLYADPLSPPFPTLHFFQPLYGEPNYLAAGDIVAVVQDDCRCKFVFTCHSGITDVSHNSFYWNYTALDYSNPVGSYLFPGQAWGVLRGELDSVDLRDVDIVLPTMAVSTDESEADTADSDVTSVAQNEEDVIVDAVDSDVNYVTENEEEAED